MLIASGADGISFANENLLKCLVLLTFIFFNFDFVQVKSVWKLTYFSFWTKFWFAFRLFLCCLWFVLVLMLFFFASATWRRNLYFSNFCLRQSMRSMKDVIETMLFKWKIGFINMVEYPFWMLNVIKWTYLSIK